MRTAVVSFAVRLSGGSVAPTSIFCRVVPRPDHRRLACLCPVARALRHNPTGWMIKGVS